MESYIIFTENSSGYVKNFVRSDDIKQYINEKYDINVTTVRKIIKVPKTDIYKAIDCDINHDMRLEDSYFFVWENGIPIDRYKFSVDVKVDVRQIDFDELIAITKSFINGRFKITYFGELDFLFYDDEAHKKYNSRKKVYDEIKHRIGLYDKKIINITCDEQKQKVIILYEWNNSFICIFYLSEV